MLHYAEFHIRQFFCRTRFLDCFKLSSHVAEGDNVQTAENEKARERKAQSGRRKLLRV